MSDKNILIREGTHMPSWAWTGAKLISTQADTNNKYFALFMEFFN